MLCREFFENAADAVHFMNQLGDYVCFVDEIRSSTKIEDYLEIGIDIDRYKYVVFYYPNELERLKGISGRYFYEE